MLSHLLPKFFCVKELGEELSNLAGGGGGGGGGRLHLGHVEVPRPGIELTSQR